MWRFCMVINVSVAALLIASIGGCAGKVDPLVLETSLSNARNALADARDLEAEVYAAELLQRAARDMENAERAAKEGSDVESLELAFQAEMQAQLAAAKARHEAAQQRLRAVDAEILNAMGQEMSYRVAVAETRQAIAEEQARRALARAQRAEEIAAKAQANAERAQRESERARLRAQTEVAIERVAVILNTAKDAGALQYAPEEYRVTAALLGEVRALLAQDDFSQAQLTVTEAERRAIQTKRLTDVAAEAAAESAESEKLQVYTSAKVAITRAQVELDKAETVNAFFHAKSAFEQAQQRLDQANNALNTEQYDRATNLASQAESSAREAYAIAEVEDRKRREQMLQEEQLAQAKDMIFKAEEALRQAEQLEAPKIASTQYTQAKASLEEAKQALTAENYAKASSAAQNSYERFVKLSETIEQVKATESQILNATQKIAGTESSITDDGVLVRFSGNLFESGRTELNPKFFPAAQELAAVIQTFPDLEIRIEGHSDSSGNEQLNLELTQKRAAAFTNYLSKKGNVTPTRLTTEGLGEVHPIADNTSAQGRERNRRIDVYFLTRKVFTEVTP